MSFFQILTLFNPQKDIQRIFSLQVGLRSALIRKAIQKKMSPPLIVVLFVPEIPPKVNGFVTLSGGGWVSRKDHLVTLLRCHYWLGGVGVQGKSDNVTIYHVFLEAVASLGLVVSLSQSVTESVCNTLVKLDKVSIGGSRISPA